MKKYATWLAALLALTLVAAACGDDDDDDGAAASSDAATETTVAADGDEPAGGDGVAAAQAIVDANAVAPTQIPHTVPLDSVPEPRTVAWMQCELPSCTAITPGLQDAADLLGWTLEVVPVQSFDPGAGFQTAIDLGVDYIAITGTPLATIADQIDAAAAAGIGVFSCFDTTEPLGEENNVWSQCGDAANVTGTGNLLAQAIIADSGGTANTLMVNIPDFAVLVSEREGAQAAYDANCPDCQFSELAVTLDQLLAGEVAGALVAALQEDPTIDYVHFAFDGLTGGVSSVLADAGLLEQVTLVGVDFSAAVLQEIVDGTMAFWTANPKPFAGWVMVDGMARHSIGQEHTEERIVSNLPTFLVSDAAAAEPLIATDGWYGPEGLQEQFAALWGIEG